MTRGSRPSRLLLVVALAGLVVGLTACGSSKPKVAPVPVPTDLRGKTAVDIDAHFNQFTPVSVIIDAGTKVTWHNQDTVLHNVKKSSDALDFGAPFGTDQLNAGGSYSFTFAKVGTFFYACTIHAAMSGKVVVVAKA